MKRRAIFILLLFLLALSLPSWGQQLEVHYLDIGQGDAILVRLPGGDDLLIDSGDPNSRVVEKLRARGVRRLALAVASHPHADHIGEMVEVLRAFPVALFWDSGFPHPTRTYEKLLEEINSRGIEYQQPRAGERKQLGQVAIEVLHPAPGPPLDDNPNNSSIVMRLSYGDKRFLFTGDAELAAWGKMFRERRGLLRADVLKAAHHGSSNGTTSGVLSNVRPSIVVISCGLGNSYHHPHPRVMRLLRAAARRIELYRTDLHGDITIKTDGQNLRVETEKEPPANMLYLNGDSTAERLGLEVRRRPR